MMKLKDKEMWKKWVDGNKSIYGKACVDVARRVMEILDDGKEFDTYQIICQADKDIKMGGISGYMAGRVARMVSDCHERGKEFGKKWNIEEQIKDEGEKVNKTGGVLNPALLNI